MQILSNSTGYAISALACLVNPECPTKQVPEIAACSGVPAPYLAKLVQKLAQAGIVECKRGYRGGVRLTRPPNQISVLEISEAIEGERETDRCMLGLDACSDERACPTHAFWKTTREQIRAVLGKTTLAEVFQFEEARRARCANTTTAACGTKRTATKSPKQSGKAKSKPATGI
jgi:Rrf2 family protein